LVQKRFQAVRGPGQAGNAQLLPEAGTMDYLPLFVDLRTRRALVIGGGEQATQKICLLLKAGAEALVLAGQAGDEIRDLATAGRLTLEARNFESADLAGCAVVFCASGDAATDAAVAAAARAANVPVNVVDRADLSTFIVPAIVERDPIVIGISSGGTAPILARSLRARIEALLPARLGDLARFAARFRPAAKGILPNPTSRRRFWEKFFDSPVAEKVLAGDEKKAQAEMLPLLNRSGEAGSRGVVYLVGTGPGDADLLTFRALRLMQQADVVLYDELIGSKILDRVRRDAERIYVGKTKSRHGKPQDDVNALLLREAMAGRRVLRLKGGDPFVFGRGGEEMEFLRRHGIEVVTVPGITAALGGLAYAGIPLTHRDHASSVTFVTGHTRKDSDAIDWEALARPDRTLVVYMGLSNAGEIAARLMRAGFASGTPVAIVQNGTRADQRVTTGVLAGLGKLVEQHAGQGPALLVIGSVATLADAWVETETAERGRTA
jgi:uroporphyrin-III C-methyltransferase/precorrin-2 dehydrogenase/sirohydrochlorin ferrochelatase